MSRGLGPMIILGALGAAMAPITAGAPPAMAAEAALHTQAARIEVVPGSAFKRIVLTERAARRLDIQTAEVTIDGSGMRVVPYAAIVYDLTGMPFVYTSPDVLTFLRQPVTLARIVGNRAFLSEGPAAGTRIATVGVPQLYGAEKGVGH
jgi:hypothetical protein